MTTPNDPHNPDAERLPINTPTLINGQVTLVDYHPEWPAMFRQQAERIRAALGDRALAIEHIGSTSVPGLVAKPRIDILLTVVDAGDDAAWSPDLERAGYVLRHREIFHGEPHRVFNAPDMNVNLHVLTHGSPEARRLLGFRDWLRSHPEDAERYASAKRELAARHWRTMQDYADAKDDVVREISERMRAASTDGDLVPVGRIVRLQVQAAHLKRGEQPRRWYDPAPITEVAALRLEEGGVAGIGAGGTIHHDVHHRDHPISRYRGDNGVSVGFTSHYREMRARFGDHMANGVAGENILVESDERQTVGELGGTLLIETGDGLARLDEVIVAPPCVEFTRFCLQWPRDARPNRTVTEALQFLDNGMRAFYATADLAASTARELRMGDMVFALRESDRRPGS